MNPEPAPANTAMLLERIAVLEDMVHGRDNLLEAIQRGEIDALVVNEHPDQYQLYTLESIDQPYRVFIEQIQEGAVTLSQDGRMLYGNIRLFNLLGVPEEQAIGQKMQHFLLPKDVMTFDRMLDEARLVTTRREITLCPQGGKQIAVHLCLSFLRKAEDETLICGVMTDVSEQKHNIQELTSANSDLKRLADDLKAARALAEHANQAKTRFLAGITHELRTPLHGILGYAELLSLEGDLNTTQSKRIEVMMAAGQHLLGMINAVLDMSHIEADRLELQPVELELLDLVRLCIDVVRPAAETKHLALVLAPAVPLWLLADPIRLRQVMINLLGNAVKFTPSGTVEVRLRQTQAGACIRLEVADTGPGILPRHRDKLFQKFERLNAEAVSGIEGAGLGLAVAARLMHLMGGRIGYDDNPGGGSIFWVELPLSHGVPQQRGDAAPQPLSGKPRLRVLVVDDEAVNRTIANGFLIAAGHEVVCVDNGNAAVAAAAAEDFDVILMDVRMPGMNGLEATRRIRMLEAPRGSVRVVALTAQAFAQQVEICREAGMNDHVSKPFKQAVLLAAVEDAAMASVGMAFPIAPRPAAVADVGSTLPVFDRAAFDDMTGSLSAAELADSLQSLGTRGDSLLRRLRRPRILAQVSELVEAAHSLAGGAGTFGFPSVASAARLFEAAAEINTAATAALADQLATAIGLAMEYLRRELLAPPVP